MCGKRTQATRLNRISVQSFGTNWPLTDQQRRSPLIRFWFDQNIAGRVVLARILWLQGLAEQAWRTVQSAVGDAEALGDRSTLCYALSHGSCVIALWVVIGHVRIDGTTVAPIEDGAPHQRHAEFPQPSRRCTGSW
jgi:hypothetical protein